MNPRILIVVPTYNNPKTIRAVVEDLLATLGQNILVVDDGSDFAVEEILGSLCKGAEPRLQVMRWPENQGKGAALRAAFAWGMARGYTHVATCDGDGQHSGASIAQLVEACERKPWDLIVGVRRLDGDDVPGISRFGRKFSNFWIWYETGVSVRDSQSGMRIYPLFFLQTLKFWTKRYDFEVESMTRLLWQKVGLTEVPVDVHYPEASARVSHFRGFVDNCRISLLNVLLVTTFLLRRPPWRLSTLVAFGAAIVLGSSLESSVASLLLAVGATVLCRGPGVAVLAGWALGTVFPDFFDVSLGSVDNHAIGAALGLGLVLSLTIAAMSAARGRIFRKGDAEKSSGEKAKAWSGRHRGGSVGNGFLKIVSRTLGLGASYVCLLFITPYFFLFAPRARRSSLEFFQTLNPNSSWLKKRLHTLLHFFTFGTVLLDGLYQRVNGKPVFNVSMRGRNLYHNARAEGRGVVLVTAHAGGWQFAAEALAHTASEDQDSTQRVIAEFVAEETGSAKGERRLPRVSVHNESTPLLHYRHILLEGGSVCMMVDRPLSDKVEVLPFMGRLAVFDQTPFRLADRTGSALIYCFAIKTGFRSYHLDMVAAAAPELPHAGGSVLARMQHFAQELESHITEHPHQWFNFYPFFSTRPMSALALTPPSS